MVLTPGATIRTCFFPLHDHAMRRPSNCPGGVGIIIDPGVDRRDPTLSRTLEVLRIQAPCSLVGGGGGGGVRTSHRRTAWSTLGEGRVGLSLMLKTSRA